MEVWDYPGTDESETDVLRCEDKIVNEKYSKPWIWTTEEFKEIFKEAGFSKFAVQDMAAEESEEEKAEFGGYSFYTIEE